MTFLRKIDPEEHKKVVNQVAQLLKETADLKAQAASAEKETASAKSALAKLNKDVSMQKALVEKQNAMITKMKADKDSVLKSSAATLEISKERDQLKEKIQKMEFEAKSVKTELDGANQRNEALKIRMREFILTLSKQKEKIDELEKALATALAPAGSEIEGTTIAAKTTTGSVKPLRADKASAAGGSPTQEDFHENKAAAPNQEAKEGNLAVPEGGFKFGPGGKRPLLDTKTSETSLKPAMKPAASLLATSDVGKSMSHKVIVPSETNQEKAEMETAPKLETPPVLEFSVITGPSSVPSTVRPHSPMRDNVESQAGGNDSEATKKKALIAKLNEKKRKLAEAKAQKQAQLAKSPSDPLAAEENVDAHDKIDEIQVASEKSVEVLGAVSTNTAEILAAEFTNTAESRPAEPRAQEEYSRMDVSSLDQTAAKKAKAEEAERLESIAAVGQSDLVAKEATSNDASTSKSGTAQALETDNMDRKPTFETKEPDSEIAKGTSTYIWEFVCLWSTIRHRNDKCWQRGSYRRHAFFWQQRLRQTPWWIVKSRRARIDFADDLFNKYEASEF